eukprot:TRINITY_DN74788_c0_g1_i1.p1 TRINITY_DN74788_c0_g1~~TRINITY_DN74788_c0_g1_i1.p1  ORF type:complete len:254 (-),score=36.25 TRINITY_DN74788_c0_g1_i1:65-736(-)
MADVRRGFVQKVYGTVAVQLVATAAIAAPIASADDTWLEEHIEWRVFSCVGLIIMAVCVFCCAPHLVRKHPWNLVFLSVFTAMESVTVGFVCAAYTAQSVLWCVVAAGCVAGVLTLFASSTKIDVTRRSGAIRAASFSVFIVGVLGFFLRVPFLYVLYSLGSAVLFAGYLIYDTQLVLGGKHHSKHFCIDDYVLAALSIYLDLIRLFMFLLRFFGDRRSSRRS